MKQSGLSEYEYGGSRTSEKRKSEYHTRSLGPATFGISHHGYELSHVNVDGGGEAVRIHRLAAVAWFGWDAVVGNVIHHKNTHKRDNREENLEPMPHEEHMKHHHTIDENKLISELQRLGDKLGRTPKARDMRRAGKFNDSTYAAHFGSWSAAVEEAGFKPNQRGGVIDDDRLISELQRLKSNLGGRLPHEIWNRWESLVLIHTPTISVRGRRPSKRLDVTETSVGYCCSETIGPGVPKPSKRRTDRW